ncbi:MAG TPA: pseudouridine synthase [Elusimicrobia bacterium]|nr:pseudouridine synthase [Elusimicrobiota bacterium]
MLISFYKPYGVVTQFSPSGEARTLADFGLPPAVYPAGRLDADSEGLLLLTDDGALQHSLTDPRHGHPRTYLVQVERVPSAEALERLRKGVLLKDGKTRPCKAKMLDSDPDLHPRDPPIRCRKAVPTTWLEMTLTEGRNRQIRRMGAAIGHPVLRLVRSKIGKRGLEGLTPGQWRLEGLTPDRRPDPQSEA